MSENEKPAKKKRGNAKKKKSSKKKPTSKPNSATAKDQSTTRTGSQQAPKKKSNAGRPSSYDPAYCKLLINHMGAGFSFESFAGVLGVSRDTLYFWAKRFPEFSDAKEIGFGKCQRKWEEIGLAGSIGISELKDGTKLGRFSSAAWIFNMKNRFDWRDKREHSGPGGDKLSVADLFAMEEADDDENFEE